METNKRKHYTQMSEAEIAKVLRRVRTEKFTFTPHAKDRMRQRRVNEVEVLTMLGYGKVVEVHNNIGNEIRVLMRGKVAGRYVVASVSLTTKKVCTAYANALNDHHKTLDKSLYTWKVDLTEIL